VVIGVTPFEWDVRVSSKEDPGGHADVYWPGSLHHCEACSWLVWDWLAG